MDIKVIKYKHVWVTFSSILVLLSVIGIFTLGLKPGMDFTGGTLMEVEFQNTPDLNTVRDAIKSIEGEIITNTAVPEGTDAAPEAVDAAVEAAPAEETTTPADAATSETETTPTSPETITPAAEQPLTEYSEINTSGKIEIGSPVVQMSGEKSVMIRIKYIDEAIHKRILTKLTELNGAQPVIEHRYENIGPVIGKTLQQNAYLSVVLAAIFIILFLWFAFRKLPRTFSSLKFGVSAVLALIHDVLIVCGIFTLLGYFLNVEIDTLFITALLTVMGFSVHDTIVVFDRIRENSFRSKGKTFAEIANESINQTLARSINTSMTTLITLLALFIFGGESIRWFVFAMMAGIVVGTYSSIFLATPILVYWHKKLTS